MTAEVLRVATTHRMGGSAVPVDAVVSRSPSGALVGFCLKDHGSPIPGEAWVKPRDLPALAELLAELLADLARQTEGEGLAMRRPLPHGGDLYRTLDGRGVILVGQLLLADLTHPEAAYLRQAFEANLDEKESSEVREAREWSP